MYYICTSNHIIDLLDVPVYRNVEPDVELFLHISDKRLEALQERAMLSLPAERGPPFRKHFLVLFGTGISLPSSIIKPIWGYILSYILKY